MEARKEIVASYQRALDALRRCDVDAAIRIETSAWISITVGQAPRSGLAHIRDTWTTTSAGWKRKYEKLTINERTVDGR